MNARHTVSSPATRFVCVAGHPLVPSLIVTLGLLLATASVTGQDRIRIVETPRTAMRETRSITLQARRPQAGTPQAGTPQAGTLQPRTPQPDVQRQRVGPPNQTPAAYEERFVTEMQDQYRTVYVPVIESQTEPTRVWWNPLGISTGSFQPRPVVRWEQRVEKTRVAVRYREYVAETTELSQNARSSSSNVGATATADSLNRTRTAGKQSTTQ